MNRGLDPLYASAIQTGYSTINRLADLLSSDHSLGMLALLNQFGRAIQQTRRSILSSDQTFTLWQLKSYMIFLKQLDSELCRNKHEPLTIHGELAYLLPDTIHSRG
jgi:hypothetical protein